MQMQEFVPSPETSRQFRSALGRFPTGVTIVTTQGADGPEGITVNSFASVSLDPALVLWCPGKFSNRHDLFAHTPHFSIHVLASDQHDLAMRYTRSGVGFDHDPVLRNPEGQPILPRCLARFDCAHHALLDGGDHSIVIGKVLRCVSLPGEALVFHEGEFAIVGPNTASKS